MASSDPRQSYTKQQLESLKRSDLQKLFKTQGLIGANQKSEILVDVLVSHFGNGTTGNSNVLETGSRGKENVGPGPGAGSQLTELQTQIAQLDKEIAALRSGSGNGIGNGLASENEALRARVEMLEKRQVEWEARLTAAEMKWQESMASVQEQLEAFRRGHPSSSGHALSGITEEDPNQSRLRHSSVPVPATPRSSSATRLTFAGGPSVTSLGKRRRGLETDEAAAAPAPARSQTRVVSTASVLDARDVDDGLRLLRTPPHATSRPSEPRTPPPGLYGGAALPLTRDHPSPSPAQTQSSKKRAAVGLGLAPGPGSPRSASASVGARLPSTRIDALFDTPAVGVVPLEPMHAPFHDPSSTPGADVVDRAIHLHALDGDGEDFIPSPVIPDLLGPELSRLSPMPGMGMGKKGRVGRVVPETPPAMATLFGTERSRDTRFGDEGF